jgi:pyruvate dehydrogenase E2 component (dihydrolipoamide acetyltransferase)
MAKTEFNNDWRKVAAAIYKKPTDGKVFGSADVDVTELEKYVSLKRKDGVKLTLTHIFTLIIARAISTDIPELNCYIRRGNVIHRKQVDAMVSVLIEGGQMSSVLIKNADKLSLNEIVDILSDGIKNTRKGDENSTMKMKGVIGKIPWPFRRLIFNFIKMVTVNWGLSLSGLSANNYGSFVCTNIGSIGLDSGFPALFPISNVSFVFVMGGISKKPVVINDKIVVRRMMTISSAMDHRIVDAVQGGKLFKYLKKIIREPELLEEI